MKLRMQTPDPSGTRNALFHLDNDAWGLLGLSKPRNEEYHRFTFPTVEGRTIYLDVEIDHYYDAAWLLWAEHAQACGLISSMEVAPEEQGGTP